LILRCSIFPDAGLIILKPSPNSQLLTQTEPNSNQAICNNSYHSNSNINEVNSNEATNSGCNSQPDPRTPQSMHEGTPESGDDTPMTPLNNPFSPMTAMLSPPESVAVLNNSINSVEDDVSEQSQLDELLQEGAGGSLSPSASHMELDFNLNLMESDQQQDLPPPPAPPPPPPPPPPPSHSVPGSQQQARRTNSQQAPLAKPAPLPGPPHVTIAGIMTTSATAVASASTMSSASLSPLQFVLPGKTNQQILLAKQQLESQLSGPAQPASIPPPSVRAGPKESGLLGY
jgi:hypothetical protein